MIFPAPTGPAGGGRAVVATVALASLLLPLNSTMIAVALGDVARAFGSDLHGVAWLVVGYLIVMASLQPLAGRIGDRVDRRALVLGGLAWFAAASVAAALAAGLTELTVFRIQQAVAGAIVMPNAVAFLRELVPEERLGRAMGAVGAVITLAAAVGPPVGGLLVALGGWHAIFLASAPVATAALVLALATLPGGRAGPADPRGRLDLRGSLLLSAGLVSGALAATRPGMDGGSRSALAVASVISLAALWVHARRHPDPIVRPDLVARPAFAGAAAAVALSNMAMYVTLLAIPLLVGARFGWASTSVGLVLAAMSLAAVAAAPAGGRLADRHGSSRPIAIGMALTTAALVPLALAPAALASWGIVACVAVTGMGLGLSSSPMQLAAVTAAPAGETAAAAGLFSTARYLGSIVGTALLAAPLAPSGTDGFGVLFALMSAAALMAAAMAPLIARDTRPRRRRPVRAAGAAPGQILRKRASATE